MVAIVPAAAFLGVFFPTSVAFACTCAPPPSDAEALDDYDAVFAGVPVDHEDPEGDQRIISSARPIVWTFAVDTIVKGDISREQEIISAASGASCGYRFRKGKRYLVFAYHGTDAGRVNNPDADLHTGICTNTHGLAADEGLPFAAAPTPSDGAAHFDDFESGPGPWEFFYSGLAVALLTTAIIWVFRRD